MRAYHLTTGHLFTLHLTVDSLTVQVISGADEQELTKIGEEWVSIGHIPRPFGTLIVVDRFNP